MNAIQPIAQHFVKVVESPEPSSVYCYSPGIAVLPDGVLIATMDFGGDGVAGLAGAAPYRDSGKFLLGQAFASADQGQTWTRIADFPFMHARPFVAGNSLYIIGHNGDLGVIRSDDGGRTWSEPGWLTSGEIWHQAPCNVHYYNDHVYLVMERVVYHDTKAWNVSCLAPVLMKASVHADLTERGNWTFASELVFRDAVNEGELDYFAAPYYQINGIQGVRLTPTRGCAPMGWLETNVVQFTDPDHCWFDPDGRTFHLWMRAHTGGTGYAAVAKVVEQPDGSLTTMLETMPSGRRAAFVPCPGGQMKFHILYDEVTKLYWLLSTQATDSMTRVERLADDRYGLPNNERHRLQLHFSKNCVDWCFAALVAVGDTAKQGRHYASMAFAGDDLHIVSRSGDERARDAHDSNFISFHTIKSFRELAYL